MAKKHEDRQHKEKPVKDVPAPISAETPSTRRLLIDWRERALRAEAALRLIVSEVRDRKYDLSADVMSAADNVINDAEKRGGEVI